MKIPGLIIAAAALALAGAPAHSATTTEKSEARLALMLEGRTAGEPLACIPAFRSSQPEVIGNIALVYDSGDILYVARLTDPQALGPDDAMVINRFGSQLCHTDIVRTIARSGGYTTGVVFLGKFVPYRKQQ